MILPNLEIKLKGRTKIVNTNACKIKKWTKSHEAYVLSGRLTQINLAIKKIITLKLKG